jgi:hypothetical protein
MTRRILGRNVQISLAMDASLFKWGASVWDGQGELCMGDFWAVDDLRPIHLTEAHALLFTLSAIKGRIENHMVDVSVDNHAVVHAWNREGSRDGQLLKIVKEHFHLIYQSNADLKLQYIPADKVFQDGGIHVKQS